MVTSLLFLNPSMKFEFVKVEDGSDRWVLFSNPPLKFDLDKDEGRC
jgi:hypothetical protein